MRSAHPEHDDVAPYLLGALSDAEREEFERHLGGCAECQREVAQLQSAVDALAGTAPAVEPPPSLRAAVMREVERDALAPAQRQPERPPLLARLRIPAVALASLAAGALGGYTVAQLSEDEPRRLSAVVDGERLAGARAALLAPAAGDDPAVLVAHGLEQLPPRRTYQLWLARGDEIVPGPLFRAGVDGTATTAIADGLRGVDAVMVTRERARGAKQPTEEPVLTVQL